MDEEDEPTPLDAVEATDPADPVEAGEEPSEADVEGIQWSRVLAYGVLPGLALLLALTAGFLKYVDNSVRDDRTASIESVAGGKGQHRRAAVLQTGNRREAAWRCAQPARRRLRNSPIRT